LYGADHSPVVIRVASGEAGPDISVTNEGSGISERELPYLFQRFHRTEQARQSGVKGIGLGLYITRALVEAHGGKITVDSVPGDTTTFRIHLPRQTCASGASSR